MKLPRIRRFLPRYSLRTLAIFLLLVTAGMGLWWHWEAWRPEARVRFSGLQMLSLAYSPDGLRLAAAWQPDWGTVNSKVVDLGAPQSEYPPDENRFLGPEDVSAQLACVWWPRAPRSKPVLLSLADSYSSGGGRRMPDGTVVNYWRQDYCAETWGTVPPTSETPETSVELVGHKEDVTSAALSSDGTRLATASEDSTARLWDTDNGRCIMTVGGSGSPMSAVAFSADEKAVVTARADGVVRFWDAASGSLLRSLRVGQGIRALCFSPDGSRFVEAEYTGWAGIRVAKSGALVQRLDAGKCDVTCVAFSPGGRRLALGTNLGEVLLWHRVRPEWWWGVFWLWEFWLAAALAGLFAWSVWRDRKVLALPSTQAADA